MKKNLFVLFCFSTFGVMSQIPSYVPTNGLVGWWPFNGNANDESGNGNNGTVNGATLSSDRFGNANRSYSFDGTGNYIQTTALHNQIYTFSVSVWAKSQTGGTILTGKKHVSAPSWVMTDTVGITLDMLNETNSLDIGKIRYLADGNFFQKGQQTAIKANNNTWHHIVGVWNGPNTASQLNSVDFSIFIDGQLASTSSINLNSDFAPLNGYTGLIFGKHTNWQSWSNFNGQLDDIGIYNRALTQQEITALYQGCSTPTATITPQTNTNFCQGNNVILNATTGANYTYEWYKNSSLISGATTNSYAASSAGNYTVKVIDGSCNATSSATTLTLIDTVTWTGIVDNDWHKPCNWSPEIVPECCNSVKIPFTPISPVVSGVGKAKNVTLYSTSGATLTVNNGANLQIETCPVNKTENSCPTLPVLTTTVISSATQTSAVSGGNITYTGASSITARGVCWSTTTAPTIANSKTTDGSGIGTYTSNLTGLTAGTTYYVRAYATNASGTSYGNEVSFIALNPQPAYPLGSVFCNGTPTLVVDVTNPTTGKTWMDRNLGASQAATSSTDPLAYGDLYQWGRGSDGHQCRNSITISVLSNSESPGNSNFIFSFNPPYDWLSPQNNSLWLGVNGLNNPCPSNYRLPTDSELNSERLSWISNNSIGAFESALKFSLGGYRILDDGTLFNVGNIGYYWSSTLITTNSRVLNISTTYSNIYNYFRAYGGSIRCIKN